LVVPEKVDTFESRSLTYPTPSFIPATGIHREMNRLVLRNRSRRRRGDPSLETQRACSTGGKSEGSKTTASCFGTRRAKASALGAFPSRDGRCLGSHGRGLRTNVGRLFAPRGLLADQMVRTLRSSVSSHEHRRIFRDSKADMRRAVKAAE
jgi:hypothetical protein